MTRAKQAMYVITKAVGQSKSANFPRLLHETLGEAWSAGDPQWYEETAFEEAAADESRGQLPVLQDSPMPASPRRPARRPSAAHTGIVRAADAFALEAKSGADFGTAVHALLAEIEWSGPSEVEHRSALWQRGDPATEEAIACLDAPELAAVWQRPAGAVAAEVWRERSFELVLDGAWVSGVFDRVVIVRDAAGRAERAAIYDFKTDAIGPAEVAAAVERHGSQLHIYRQAAARLTGLPGEAVTAQLVLTRLRTSQSG
jgi:ATP-dependent helicase/nuclease subunit A